MRVKLILLCFLNLLVNVQLKSNSYFYDLQLENDKEVSGSNHFKGVSDQNQDCMATCVCCIDDICDEDTTFCLNGCKDGIWGHRCFNNCPETCVTCTQMSDSGYPCTKCQDGIWGNKCLNNCPESCVTCTQKSTETEGGFPCTRCKDGNWGLQCRNKCPEVCATCNQDSVDGFPCLQCQNGRYGSSCDNECSIGCEGGFCDIENGHCVCKSDYIGDKCETCATNTYGTEYREACSRYCKTNKCSQTGHCIDGCMNEFEQSGTGCRKEEQSVTMDDGYVNSAAIGGALGGTVVGIMIVAGIIVLIVRKRRSNGHFADKTIEVDNIQNDVCENDVGNTDNYDAVDGQKREYNEYEKGSTSN